MGIQEQGSEVRAAPAGLRPDGYQLDSRYCTKRLHFSECVGVRSCGRPLQVRPALEFLALPKV